MFASFYLRPYTSIICCVCCNVVGCVCACLLVIIYHIVYCRLASEQVLIVASYPLPNEAAFQVFGIIYLAVCRYTATQTGTRRKSQTRWTLSSKIIAQRSQWNPEIEPLLQSKQAKRKSHPPHCATESMETFCSKYGCSPGEYERNKRVCIACGTQQTIELGYQKTQPRTHATKAKHFIEWIPASRLLAALLQGSNGIISRWFIW